MDTSTRLDSETTDYYGSDVSSVTDGQPSGFNDIAREDAYVESDTSSATDGLIEGYNDRAADDRIGPDPEAIMQSVGDGGGGDVAADGALTDLTQGGQAAYPASSESEEASTTPTSASSSASTPSTGAGAPGLDPNLVQAFLQEQADDDNETPADETTPAPVAEPEVTSEVEETEVEETKPETVVEYSMNNSLAELQEAARESGVSDKGTKAELLERISNPHEA